MSGWISLALVSLSISLDGFGVGLAYGMRKMRIPFASLLIIALCSFCVVFASMTIGQWVMAWITPDASKKAGAAVLIVIGLFTWWRMFAERKSSEPAEAEPVDAHKPYQFEWTIRLFGLIIHILRDPARADADRSGHIVGWEAVMLGLALSLDAFGAGISLALLHYPPLFTAVCVALVGAILLYSGMANGRRFAAVGWFQRVSYLPPMLLIGIGLLKMGG